MTQTRPATPTDPPDLPRKPLGAGRSPRVTREQLYPVTDTTGDHHNDHRHPAPAATGQVDAATIADRYPIAASASSFIVQTATAEHPLAPLDDGPPVLFPAPGPAGGIGSAGPTRTGRGALPTTTPKSTTGHVTVGNQQLRVDVRAGNRTGTPLVMCCGIGASFEVLQPLVDALDPGIDIIRFDAPGVGGSPVGALPNGFPQLARMLDRLLDELGYDRVDVLGFSWGGALAQQFAVQHAGRCRRLVLISTNTGVLSVPAALSVLAKMVTPHGVDDYAATMAGSVHGRDSRARTDDVRRLFRHTRVSVAGPGYLYQLAATASWSSLPFLTLIRQPVLVMGGDDDPIVPVANARILANLIPNATLHVFPGGHLEPLTAATDFGPRITQFLTRQRP